METVINRKVLLLFFYTFLTQNFVRGQNLVPDSDFSQVKQLPTSTSYHINDLLHKWFAPNNATPLFVTSLSVPIDYHARPNWPPNNYLPPFVGASYLQIVLFSLDNLGIRQNPRVYASSPLLQPIQEGDWVHFKMNYYAHPGRGTLSNQYSNNLGIVISDSLHFTHREYINLVPDYNIDTVLSPTYIWQEIDTCVIAVRGGQYVTIGNFFPNSQTIADHSTIYSLQVGIDNIFVGRMELKLVNGDTVYGCSNEPITLEATNDCDYKWALKSNPQNILHQGPKFEVKPTISTTYLVYGWTDTLEIQVIVDERIGLNLGPDQNLCLGDTHTLDISNLRADQIFWNTGDTTSIVQITKSGWYKVAVTRGNCIEMDSILVTYDSLPKVQITSHQLADCLGADVTLKTTAQNDYKYIWNTGEEGPQIVTIENGTFWVTVSNFCGSVTDTIVLENEACICRIFIPNAFSPESPHEENRFFKPQGTCTFIDYQFAILNRWGMPVFESNSNNKFWDGNLPNGQAAPAGVYTYTFFYHGFTEEGVRATERIQGTLTLLR